MKSKEIHGSLNNESDTTSGDPLTASSGAVIKSSPRIFLSEVNTVRPHRPKINVLKNRDQKKKYVYNLQDVGCGSNEFINI